MEPSYEMLEVGEAGFELVEPAHSKKRDDVILLGEEFQSADIAVRAPELMCWRRPKLCATVVVALLVTLGFVVWLFGADSFYSRRVEHSMFGYSRAERDFWGRRVIRTCWFGDSLIESTDRQFDVVHTVTDRLRREFPDYAFVSIESGHGGNKIADLAARLEMDCLRWNPDSAILYFDSDASDTPLSMLGTEADVQYKRDLNLTLTRLVNAMPGRVVLAGPTLLGELPRGENERDKIAEHYVGMNRAGAEKHGIDYLDTRDAFFEQLPEGWRESSGFLTLDGEHHNERGAAIVAELFHSALRNFYTEREKTRVDF